MDLNFLGSFFLKEKLSFLLQKFTSQYALVNFHSIIVKFRREFEKNSFDVIIKVNFQSEISLFIYSLRPSIYLSVGALQLRDIHSNYFRHILSDFTTLSHHYFTRKAFHHHHTFQIQPNDFNFMFLSPHALCHANFIIYLFTTFSLKSSANILYFI